MTLSTISYLQFPGFGFLEELNTYLFTVVYRDST